SRATAPGTGARRGPTSPSTPYKACTAHAGCWRTQHACVVASRSPSNHAKGNIARLIRSPSRRGGKVRGIDPDWGKVGKEHLCRRSGGFWSLRTPAEAQASLLPLAARVAPLDEVTEEI